jgi:4-amino-4-deoxy-L-arabinose transferase-like glycosyltransferase
MDRSKRPANKAGDWGWLLAIVALALTLRFAAAIYWHRQAGDQLFRFGDSVSYWTLAESIADGKAYQYGSENARIFRTPLYPLMLAPFTMIANPSHAVLAARCLGCLLGTIAVALIYQATLRWCSPLAARSAAILAACYPGAIGMSVFILSEAAFCPLMIASMHQLCLAIDRDRWDRWGWAGLLTGLATLTRPSWILWPIAVAVTLALLAICRPHRSIANLRSLAFGLAVMTLAIALTLAPWWYRNYTVSGRFVLTTLQVGASLYDGLHATATGGSDENMNFVDQFAERQREEDSRSASKPADSFEYRLDRRMRDESFRWAWSNRGDFLRLALLKLQRTWSPLPQAPQLGNRFIRWSEAIGYLGIVGLASIGSILPIVREHRLWIYALPIAYFAAIHAVFVGSVRYRQPAVLAACVLAGIALGFLIETFVIRKQPISKEDSTNPSSQR